jgi:hypothetical protein
MRGVSCIQGGGVGQQVSMLLGITWAVAASARVTTTWRAGVTRLVPKALRKGIRGQYLVPTLAVTHVSWVSVPLSPEGTAVGLDQHCEMLQLAAATKRCVCAACCRLERSPSSAHRPGS